MKRSSLPWLQALTAGLIASSLPTSACLFDCDPTYTHTVFRLPPANPGGETAAPSFDPLVVSDAECELLCGPDYESCTAIELDGDIPAIECVLPNDCSSGRRPCGLRAVRARVGSKADPIGAWLARAAHLEAASVVAFRVLADEIEAFGAPKRLVSRARASARDEVRHAHSMGKLAVRRGARPEAVRVRARGPRSLVAIALENAREGCIRETFGALVAQYQAAASTDPSVRRAMRSIARDETRHAALSWDLARWIEPRLSVRDRTRVAKERARAAERVVADYRADGQALALLGMPSTAAGKQLAERLFRELAA